MIPVLTICAFTALIAAAITYAIKRIESPFIKKVLQAIKAKLMFNSFLRYLLQIFQKIAITVSLNISLVVSASINALNLLFSFPLMAALFAFAFGNYWFLKSNEVKLSD